jgi:hypothetical protein
MVCHFCPSRHYLVRLIASQSSGEVHHPSASTLRDFPFPGAPSHLRNAAEGCDDDEKSNLNLAPNYDGCRSSHAMTRAALSYDGNTG